MCLWRKTLQGRWQKWRGRKLVGLRNIFCCYTYQKVGYGESADSIQNLPFNFHRFSISKFKWPSIWKLNNNSDSSHSNPLQTLNDLAYRLISLLGSEVSDRGGVWRLHLEVYGLGCKFSTWIAASTSAALTEPVKGRSPERCFDCCQTNYPW
jgi:hypothetical protein